MLKKMIVNFLRRKMSGSHTHWRGRVCALLVSYSLLTVANVWKDISWFRSLRPPKQNGNNANTVFSLNTTFWTQQFYCPSLLISFPLFLIFVCFYYMLAAKLPAVLWFEMSSCMLYSKRTVRCLNSEWCTDDTQCNFVPPSSVLTSSFELQTQIMR